MRRAALIVALVAALALLLHEVLLRMIAGVGSEAVGVALGPGTPPEELALMGGFVLLRTGLYLLGPGAVAALASTLLLRRRAP